MFLSTFHLTQWAFYLAIIAGLGGLAVPNRTFGQGVAIAGMDEGSVIALSPGSSTTNLTVTATPASPSGTTNLIFILERQGAVFINYTSPPPFTVTLDDLPAGKYFLSAALAGNPVNGDVSFEIQAAALAPTNDNWNQAIVLTGLETTVTGFNTDATSELNEPVHAGIGAGKSLWWSWTAVSNGFVTATTAGSSFDTVLGIYTGTSLATLAEIKAADDIGPAAFSQTTFFATNGTVYYFAVDSATTAAAGRVQLRLTAEKPPVISIASPTDGYLMLVATSTSFTNTAAAATVIDPKGVARVDYQFDGSSGLNQGGTLAPPYQLNLTNLTEGAYWLTLIASNNAGLVTITNTGFSVISLAPLVITEGFGLAKRFRVAVTGFKGPTYSLQASTNLDAWCSLATFNNFAGAEKVADTNAAQFNRRFYRATSTR
jgi:hypothetical protein